ncbi:MAG: STAS domain-containing protein [Verrucomicrobiales bacterium]
MISSARILAGSLNGVLWLRVEGNGSYEVSPQLSRFAADRIGAGVRHIVVDLESCPTMDSTFMGTLTGVAVRLMQHPGGVLQVVNPNERAQYLLSNLGLDHIFEVDREGKTWREERAMISRLLNNDVCRQVPAAAKREQMQCMLAAHENLACASEGNLPKFHDVIECLKREMHDQRV